jgi:AcrR family transcriptional regulator
MLDCFEAGLLRPGAHEVAERAGVSTRAVFRHFDSMESLVEQVAELQHERVTGQLPPLVFAGSRKERVAAFVARTSRAFELTTATRRAAVLIEPFSETVRSRHAWLRAEVRRGVRRVFAEELSPLGEAEKRERVTALRALISFTHWDELRSHERLSVAAATRVLEASVHALLRR